MSSTPSSSLCTAYSPTMTHGRRPSPSFGGFTSRPINLAASEIRERLSHNVKREHLEHVLSMGRMMHGQKTSYALNTQGQAVVQIGERNTPLTLQDIRTWNQIVAILTKTTDTFYPCTKAEAKKEWFHIA